MRTILPENPADGKPQNWNLKKSIRPLPVSILEEERAGNFLLILRMRRTMLPAI